MIKEGFRISGIWPICNAAILSGWSGWSLINKATAIAVMTLLPELTEIVKINGRVTDGEIEQCLGHLLHFDNSTRKADNCALNHGRCLWTNNERVITTYKEKLRVESLKNVEKDNKMMEKEWRISEPDRAASEDKRMKARSGAILDDGEPRAVKRQRVVKCGNSSCRARTNAAGRKEWERCQKKSCSLAFCSDCHDPYMNHKEICDQIVTTDVVV